MLSSGSKKQMGKGWPPLPIFLAFQMSVLSFPLTNAWRKKLDFYWQEPWCVLVSLCWNSVDISLQLAVFEIFSAQGHCPPYMATVTFPTAGFYSVSSLNLLHQLLTSFNLMGENNILKEIIGFALLKDIFYFQLLKGRNLWYRMLSEWWLSSHRSWTFKDRVLILQVTTLLFFFFNQSESYPPLPCPMCRAWRNWWRDSLNITFLSRRKALRKTPLSHPTSWACSGWASLDQGEYLAYWYGTLCSHLLTFLLGYKERHNFGINVY